jgi:DNA-directed RNA polymerase specialized sigma24 family protein
MMSCPTRHTACSTGCAIQEDQASWRDFFNTYWKFIYGVAIKSGLSDSEAEDVVQETVLSVAKKCRVCL